MLRHDGQVLAFCLIMDLSHGWIANGLAKTHYSIQFNQILNELVPLAEVAPPAHDLAVVDIVPLARVDPIDGGRRAAGLEAHPRQLVVPHAKRALPPLRLVALEVPVDRHRRPHGPPLLRVGLEQPLDLRLHHVQVHRCRGPLLEDVRVLARVCAPRQRHVEPCIVDVRVPCVGNHHRPLVGAALCRVHR